MSDPQLDLTQRQRGDSCRTVRTLHNPAQVHPEALGFQIRPRTRLQPCPHSAVRLHPDQGCSHGFSACIPFPAPPPFHTPTGL